MALIVGDGHRRVELERLAGRLGAGDAVVFTGRVPHSQVLDYYALLDVFAIPRVDELAARLVTPLKPYEAMAAGRPLLVSDLDALKEVVGDDRGRVFPAGDVRALVEVLTDMHAQPDQLATMAERARAWVVAERQWSHNASRYQQGLRAGARRRGLRSGGRVACDILGLVSNRPVVHVTGARPNFPKAAPVIAALDKLGVEQLLVHTGQHYDEKMSEVFFRQLGLPEPDINLEVGSGSHAAQTAAIMVGLEELFIERRPELVIVYGDVNSTVAAALVAAKLLIPVAHVEAGLRSFDMTMPEEVNRRLTDQLSDLLLRDEPGRGRDTSPTRGSPSTASTSSATR